MTANSGLPTSPLMPTAKTNFSSSTNRLTLTGAGYDNSGNLTATSLGDTLAYDAENRLASYTLSNSTTSYKYGPQGRRVQKVTPTVTETYVYDAFGKLAAEYSTAAPTAGGTYYRTTDHLGSTRLVTKQDKSDADCYDYAPFGEEIPNTLGNRSSNNCFAASFNGRHRFTGKERDDESDLDYFLARYYSGPMGRFTSVDPENAGADPAFPQTWNAYAYVANNPLKYVDKNGEYLATAWSVANVAIGVASFASNIKQGNYVAATVDAVGVALDVAATTTGLPGGAGTALRVARAADKLATATGAARTAVKGVDAVDTATTAIQAATNADDAAGAAKKLEGIYEFSDATQQGKTYVGQSHNVEKRLKKHLKSGKLVPQTTVKATPVAGGKTTREVAEQRRINQLGGTTNRPGSQTSNQRNPIGQKRRERIEKKFGSLDQD